MTENATNGSRAPGWPGIEPTWTSSAKDIVTTSLGSSRVWATVGFGIVNEVYWPSNGEPQIRDLGFIVAHPSGWYELKRIGRYKISLLKPHAPLPRIVHEGRGYRLELELSPDPVRDVLLISFRLTGQDFRLYALLAPHLGSTGLNNNAQATDGNLWAWKADRSVHLTADCGFSRTSAGYVGYSDGWQDFARHGSMQWTFEEALDGNVALMGELAAPAGVLALGFAETCAGARTLARSSLGDGFAPAQRSCCADWDAWAADLLIPQAPEHIEREALLSAAIVTAHASRTYPGAIVASLSIPWGNVSDNIGGYHLVWTRDAVEAGLASLAVGHSREARRMLGYAIATQRPDGGWSQSSFPSGDPFWTGVQLDEVGFPILLAAKLAETGAIDGLLGVSRMVGKAATYIAARGPNSPQDRWEENAGTSPFTLAILIVALVAAAEFLPLEDRAYALSLADYWNERIEDWTYVGNGPLGETFGVDGYYVRIAPPVPNGGLRGRIGLRNRPRKSLPATALVGLEFLYLARLGLRDARDARIQNTLKVTEGILGVETPHGLAYHRYNEDGYGEHSDGSPYDGSGVGRAWPLLTGERGHLDVLLGIDPLPYLQMMSQMTGPGGLIPEQIWDGPPLPKYGLEPGKPTGSAMPLVWAHAEFVKLLIARSEGRPVELLNCVERRYHARRPISPTWHWRRSQPFATLPFGRSLLIEDLVPFLLHCGFDHWNDIGDLKSEPQGIGIHGVRFDASALSSRSAIDFTFYFPEAAAWEGIDHRIIFGT